MVVVMDDQLKKLEDNLIRERGAFQLEWEKEKEAAALKLKEVRAESEAEAERLVTASAISWNSLAGKLYQLRYTKAEIMAFSKGNYEEMEIMDEDEEIESSRLRVENLEGLLEVEKKSFAEFQFRTFVYVPSFCAQNLLLLVGQGAIGCLELGGVCTASLSICFCRSIFLLEEYEVLFSQYKDRLDDNVKLSLKLEEAKRQVEQKTATILSRDLALNQLTSELAELKEKAASGCSRLDRVEADLRRLKGREVQSRADLAEIQAKNQSLVDDLAHARGNVRRAVQCEKDMNERINQLCTRISESGWELRVREMKYKKDLKFELDKRDGEITSDEGSREMKEFIRRKEELVENMCIDLTNSWQKAKDLTRQMSECIDRLTAELAESKARSLKDNERAIVTHQAFKEIVVHEQEKCDGEALHQQQLSALVAFFVEEIKFLQVEIDLMQDCFSGRTCVCKLDILSIDPIGVMDRGIGTTTAEQIARWREIVAERAPKYMVSRTKIGGSSSIVLPTPVVGGMSTALPSRKSCRVKKK
ncbi:hypothetical protein GIB67_028270 [Kingdonia uniflora]|uniref:Uncharacterized protein n=1 Tax=Kingdonia uniflora TaxID=39325 RepID=A0A7J7KZB9_9MAGN|nr:hypothetical protein GIB67_028270 [Kingdonia uniflora]